MIQERHKIGSERFLSCGSSLVWMSLSSDRSVFIMIARDLLFFGFSAAFFFSFVCVMNKKGFFSLT